MDVVLGTLGERRASPQDIFARNAPYVRPGMQNYNTQLPFLDEMAFRDWLTRNNVRFNPDAPVSDYDMRGFWQANSTRPARKRSDSALSMPGMSWA